MFLFWEQSLFWQQSLRTLLRVPRKETRDVFILGTVAADSGRILREETLGQDVTRAQISEVYKNLGHVVFHGILELVIQMDYSCGL